MIVKNEEHRKRVGLAKFIITVQKVPGDIA
jgi:hypothetical protein